MSAIKTVRVRVVGIIFLLPSNTVSTATLDPDKIAEERKFDGVFVLGTNTDLNPLEAMLCYKRLWTVEQSFRTAKHLFSTRPIFHKLDETIRGHVFCSFLALVLKTALDESGSTSWAHLQLERSNSPGRLDASQPLLVDLKASEQAFGKARFCQGSL